MSPKRKSSKGSKRVNTKVIEDDILEEDDELIDLNEEEEISDEIIEQQLARSNEEDNSINQNNEGDEKEEDDYRATSIVLEGSESIPEEEEVISSKPMMRNKMLLELLGEGSNSKRIETEEEIQLRRAENARKRKNLKEKRLEEEKRDTINKLLKKRASKSRSNIPVDEIGNDDAESSSFVKPRRPYITYGLVRTIKRPKIDLYCPFE